MNKQAFAITQMFIGGNGKDRPKPTDTSKNKQPAKKK